MAAVFVSDTFKQITDWYDIYCEFYNYKMCGDSTPTFGRDALLDTPCLSHIHLAQNIDVKALWKKKDQYYKTTLYFQSELDYWLIYAKDDFTGDYLLLTIIGPDAHDRSKWTPIYNSLFNDIVIPWINGTVKYTEPQ
ncbi:type II toxin-antitoxin system YafO family toxin [Yersinia enterocolitica]|uniref:type II toxin-antitoxin system YafO family toxin n=1 Tax=Yersinia enterocolitica TaxID=630 RepID=UPI003CFE64F0